MANPAPKEIEDLAPLTSRSPGTPESEAKEYSIEMDDEGNQTGIEAVPAVSETRVKVGATLDLNNDAANGNGEGQEAAPVTQPMSADLPEVGEPAPPLKPAENSDKPAQTMRSEAIKNSGVRNKVEVKVVEAADEAEKPKGRAARAWAWFKGKLGIK